MINLVLMAGKGQRFKDAGYMEAKPLLPIDGKPMVLRAVEHMPKSDSWIFVIREEYLQEHELLSLLRQVGKHVEIIVDSNPTGQLSSALKARKYYDTNETLFIGACDFAMLYNKQMYMHLLETREADMIVFSFTNQATLSKSPQMWGWLKQDDMLCISGVSVKVPISKNPLHDYAITGSFTFKSGKYFIDLAEEVLIKGIQINGEYYIDSLITIACNRGNCIRSFPVTYIGWGIPADYESYLSWEQAIRTHDVAVEQKPDYKFWYDYFTSS